MLGSGFDFENLRSAFGVQIQALKSLGSESFVLKSSAPDTDLGYEKARIRGRFSVGSDLIPF